MNLSLHRNPRRKRMAVLRDYPETPETLAAAKAACAAERLEAEKLGVEFIDGTARLKVPAEANQ